jgi:hypothetical protein
VVFFARRLIISKFVLWSLASKRDLPLEIR